MNKRLNAFKRKNLIFITIGLIISLTSVLFLWIHNKTEICHFLNIHYFEMNIIAAMGIFLSILAIIYDIYDNPKIYLKNHTKKTITLIITGLIAIQFIGFHLESLWDFIYDSKNSASIILKLSAAILATLTIYFTYQRLKRQDVQIEIQNENLKQLESANHSDSFKDAAKMLYGHNINLRYSGVVLLTNLAKENPKQYAHYANEMLCPLLRIASNNIHIPDSCKSGLDDYSIETYKSIKLEGLYIPLYIELIFNNVPFLNPNLESCSNDYFPVTLKNINISEFNITSRNFAHSILSDLLILDSNFDDVNFIDCNINTVNFFQSEFNGTVFNKGHLRYVSFEDTELVSSSFLNIKLIINSNFKKTGLDRVIFSNIDHIANCAFDESIWHNTINQDIIHIDSCNFISCYFPKANFDTINFRYVRFLLSDLTETTFKQCKLFNVIFGKRCSFSNTIFNQTEIDMKSFEQLIENYPNDFSYDDFKGDDPKFIERDEKYFIDYFKSLESPTSTKEIISKQ